MVLDMNPADIPNIVGEDWLDQERPFLAPHGLSSVHIPVAFNDFGELVEYCRVAFPGVAIIIGGRSTVTGGNHSLVILDGEIIDPAGSKSNDLNAMDDSLYRLGLIVVANGWNARTAPEVFYKANGDHKYFDGHCLDLDCERCND